MTRGGENGKRETTERVALLWMDSTPPSAVSCLPARRTPSLRALLGAGLDTCAHLCGQAYSTSLRLLRRSARSLGSLRWRNLASRVSHHFVTLTIAIGLALIPGSLILAIAVLLWQRMTTAAPFAHRGSTIARVAEPSKAHEKQPPPPRPPRSALALTPANAGAASTPSPTTSTAPAIPPSESRTPPGKQPSCSAGTRSGGPLLNAAEVPEVGDGFALIFPHRHLNFATDEIVGALRRVARALETQTDVPIMIGNLSGPSGSQAGQDPFHAGAYARSHGAGRAVDIAFPLLDPLGRPTPAVETALDFDDEGSSLAGIRRLYVDARVPIPPGCRRNRRRAGLSELTCIVPASAYTIDFDRTWQLVAALLLDPKIGVIDATTGRARADGEGIRFLFVAPALKEAILRAGRRAGESEAMLRIAAQLLHQPSNAEAFRRYLHVEVWCTPEDRSTCGCDDGTPPWRRWRPGVQVRPAATLLSAKRSE